MFAGLKNKKYKRCALPRDIAETIRAFAFSCAVMCVMLAILSFFEGSTKVTADVEVSVTASSEKDVRILCRLEPYLPNNICAEFCSGAVMCAASDDMNTELLARAIESVVPDAPYAVRVSYGAVLLNRVKNGRFAGTLPSVLFSAGLYPTSLENVVSERTRHAARDAMLGMDPTFGALYSIRTDDEKYQEFASKATAVYGSYAFLR